MKKNILLIIVITFALLYITINEIIMRPKLNLIKDAKKMQKNIEQLELTNLHDEIIINNKYKLNNNNHKIKGKGVIFLEKGYSFFLERKNMCAIKMNYNKDIMFQNKPCPKYRMIKQFKFHIQNKNDGVYFINNKYMFKGENVNNFIEYNNDLWRILEINNNYIKIVSSFFYDNISQVSQNIKNSEYKESINNNKSFLVKNKIYNVINLKNYVYKNGSGTIDDPYIIKAE